MNESALTDLQQRFAIPGVAQIMTGNGGLPKIHIATAKATAEIYLHGAQVTSWRPAGTDEVLFVSRYSRWEDGRAVRGGIPICFPWFRAKADDMKAPAHGLVRTRAWQLDGLAEEGGKVVVTLSTASDETTRRWWPHDFHVSHRITVGSELKLELTVTHTGAETHKPFRFEEALHTYYAVGDAAKIRVSGLHDATYLDNVDANREKTQHGDVTFAQATDNAYLHTGDAVQVVDPVLRRRVEMVKAGSQTTIVWNPWEEGAAALVDMGETEWRQMACVEAGNILDNAVTLTPGKQHTMSAVISVAELGD